MFKKIKCPYWNLGFLKFKTPEPLTPVKPSKLKCSKLYSDPIDFIFRLLNSILSQITLIKYLRTIVSVAKSKKQLIFEIFQESIFFKIFGSIGLGNFIYLI